MTVVPKKHWKAYIRIEENGRAIKQYEAVVAADTEYDAVNEFRNRYGEDCIIGWIKETKLHGLPSIGL